MRFDGYHFIMLGAVLATGSALLLAKAYLFPSFREETATTFLGMNPFQVRNSIIQRHEAIAAAIWLVGSLVAVLVGTAQAAEGGEIDYLIGRWADVLMLLVAGLMLWLGTIATTNWLSRMEYLPRMIEMQRELFERASSAVANAGRYKEEVAGGVELNLSTRQERLTEATRRLDQIGKLVDVPRGPGETDGQYVERLRPFFQPGAAAAKA